MAEWSEGLVDSGLGLGPEPNIQYTVPATPSLVTDLIRILNKLTQRVTFSNRGVMACSRKH